MGEIRPERQPNYPSTGAPSCAGRRASGVGRWRALAMLPAVLLVLAACAVIGTPEGWSAGTVVGDTLYIGTAQGELLALDRSSGETIWRFVLRGQQQTDRAIYGRVAVDGDMVYLGGYDSILYALSQDGDLIWEERVGGAIVGGPVVAEGMVLVGSSDGNLYAFGVEDESEKWRFTTGDKVWSSPHVVDGVAYFGSLDHNVYAVSLDDGGEVWQFSTGGAVTASPLVFGGRVYVGSFDGVFYAIDAKTGDEVWTFGDASNWYWSQAIAAEDTVYAPSLDGNLYALDTETGLVRWKLETEGPIAGSPTFVMDMIAVPSADGKVRLAKLEDGIELDACNIGAEIRTPLVEHEGLVYFAARDQSIRALRIKSNGNPDEEWVHFTGEADPLPRGRAPDC